MIRFVGTITSEIPGIVKDSKGVVSGDVLSWINSCVRIVDSVSNIVGLCVDKNNTKLLKKGIDDIETDEKNYQNEMEQEVLKKRYDIIKKMKEDFKKNKKELVEKFTLEKTNLYSFDIQRKQEISNIMEKMREDLRSLIDLYDNEIAGMVSSEEYSVREKRQFDECRRLLYKQFNKNIDI